jgi:hypothetical protein
VLAPETHACLAPGRLRERVAEGGALGDDRIDVTPTSVS